MPERTLAFRIDEELYKKVRFRLAGNGKTLRAYVLGLIEADLEKNAREKPKINKEELLEKANEIIKLLQEYADE